MEDRKYILKQILMFISIITLPSLAAWIFGAWAAIAILIAFLCGLVYYTVKYRG